MRPELRAALEPFREDAETWLRLVTENADKPHALHEDTKLKDGRTVGDWVRLGRVLGRADEHRDWPDEAALVEIARNYAPSYDGQDSMRLSQLRNLVLDHLTQDREP